MRMSGLDAVLGLGDAHYRCGDLDAFKASYDRTWGRLKQITYPVAGNHEYDTRGATGYFDYFGERAGPRGEGYYSFDLGTWHLIALNSECGQVGGCDAGSPQGRWLKADLEAHRTSCTLAFWHRPMFSSGPHGNDQSYRAFWHLLYEAGVDVILNAHDHIYERFAPQTPAGVLDRSRGIRQFTVGTGGGSHYMIVSAQPNSEVRDNTAYGILRMTLRAASYDWVFMPAPPGTFTDSGSGACH
jgi:Calcineurin-like phosphoesterase